MNFSLQRIQLAQSLLGSLIAVLLIQPGLVCAQESDRSEDWQEYADSRPFPTSQMRIPKWRLTDGPHVRSAFRAIVDDARKSTVRVRTDGRDTALGGIVGADGWILTKATRLPGEITCVLPDERELKAEIAGVDTEYDLALLKVDAQQLPALDLKAVKQPPEVGAWLATVGTRRGPQAIGVLSVGPREIDHRSGTLGVLFDDRTSRPIIEEVFDKTAAKEAGLQANDEMLAIDGRATPTREAFIRGVRDHSPGDRVTMRVRRGDQTLELSARLQGQPAWRLPTREEFQNQLGSKLSQRRGGFPVAMQHDAVVKPSDCGGPLVNLDGQVVGFNLARAGRTETYAVPVDVVARVVEELKSKQ